MLPGNAWDRSPTPWGPAGTAQVNPAHGAVSLDYWTANIVSGAEPYDMAHSPRNSSALMVFEPE